MTNRLRILLVEDSEDDADVLIAQLRHDGLDAEYTRVESADAMRAALSSQGWDVVISDYSMAAFRADDARALLSEVGPDIPFIIVSCTAGEEIAVSALKAGAHDFMAKGKLSRLAPAIEREMREAGKRRTLRATGEALADTHERMRLALEASAVGTWEWNVLSDRVVWSELLERLHGVAAGGFGGTYDAFLDTIHPGDKQRLREHRQEFLAQAGDSRVEYRVRWPDGSVHWIASIGRTFHNEAGLPLRAAGIGIDITAQKQLEEQVLQSQKMDSIGNLAGGIAHDFNNLLTAVAGYCELITQHPGLAPEVGNDVNEIRRTVERGADLTRQLLALGRKQLLAPRAVSLNEVVGSLQGLLPRVIEENVRFDFRLAPDLAPVDVDPGQMEQVLVNLAVNARDAMPEGGILTIETANVMLDARYTQAHVGVRPGPHVRLSVSDTGAGIPPTVRERMFEPFFTTKARGHGTGLGLATVYGIVKQSGGHIGVDSEPGRGATFRLYFPVAAAVPLMQPTKTEPMSPSLTGTETILLVEDEPNLRALAERILRRYGYTVLVASDAADARRICTGYTGRIDVILTDVIMPGGSGRTLCEWAREHRPDAKVLYMSGYADDVVAHQGVRDLETLFIQKPFSPEGLACKLREALS